MMNQNDKNINYCSYPVEPNYINHNMFIPHKKNENQQNLMVQNEFYGIVYPENTQNIPFDNSLYLKSQINQMGKVNNNCIQNIYPENNINAFTLSPPIAKNAVVSNQISLISPNIPNNPSNEQTKQPNKKVVTRRTRWTKEEEDSLLRLVSAVGARRWNQIASILKTKTAKQCRDHFANRLDPKIKNSLWTVEEERILLIKYQEYGPHWSRIKKFLPGRTTSIIKNYMAMLLKENKHGLSHEFQIKDDKNKEKNAIAINASSSEGDNKTITNQENDNSKNTDFNYFDIGCLLNKPNK